MTRLRQGDPVVVAGLTLTPIEQVTIWGNYGQEHLIAGGSKLPVAIVIRSVGDYLGGRPRGTAT